MFVSHALRRSWIAAFMFLAIAVLASQGVFAAMLTISGTPPASATVGQTYSFTPTVTGASTRRSLTFSIRNKPSWIRFDSSTGTISGVPVRTGTWSSIRISVSDGRTRVRLPSFSIKVAASTANQAPTISGSPATSVQATQAYSFVPSAKDPEGRTLMFSIENKPSWAAFSTVSGALSGSPTATQVGTYSNIGIRVTDGTLTASLPAFAITVTSAPAPAPSNHAPVISGTPVTSATAGTAYAFQPTASDADGNTLTFSIQGKPAWASFSSTTGRLSGTPSATHVGSYANIVISVSDNQASASLAPFSITVGEPKLGTITLNWVAPTQNTNQSALTDLAGYRIVYGNSPTALTQSVEIANPSVTTCLVENLPAGTWYFSMKAYSSAGTESQQTMPVSGVIN